VEEKAVVATCGGRFLYHTEKPSRMFDGLIRDAIMALVAAMLLTVASTGASSMLSSVGLGATLSTLLSVFLSTLLVFGFGFLVITYTT